MFVIIIEWLIFVTLRYATNTACQWLVYYGVWTMESSTTRSHYRCFIDLSIQRGKLTALSGRTNGSIGAGSTKLQNSRVENDYTKMKTDREKHFILRILFPFNLTYDGHLACS